MIRLDAHGQNGAALIRLALDLVNETLDSDEIRPVGDPADGLCEYVSPDERARECDVASRTMRAVTAGVPDGVELADDEAAALAVTAFAKLNDPGADRIYRALYDAGALGQ
jgi:hypothetical protein